MYTPDGETMIPFPPNYHDIVGNASDFGCKNQDDNFYFYYYDMNGNPVDSATIPQVANQEIGMHITFHDCIAADGSLGFTDWTALRGCPPGYQKLPRITLSVSFFYLTSFLKLFIFLFTCRMVWSVNTHLIMITSCDYSGSCCTYWEKYDLTCPFSSLTALET
jgi:hypothetical protein